MERPNIYRKRYVPDELINLTDDEICLVDDYKMITRWKVIKPREDFAGGLSVYLFDKGWKISRFYDIHGEFVYYYCDIIRTDYDKTSNTYTFTDLLADVIIYKDGSSTVLDLDELSEAYTSGLITVDELDYSLHACNALLCAIRSGEVNRYLELLDAYIR